MALLNYWVAFGFLSEGRHWLDQVVRKAPEPGLLRARALRASAHLAVLQGDQSAPTLQEACALARQAGDEHELAWGAYTGAMAALIAGDFGTATRLLDEALVGLRAAGDLHGLVAALGCQAVVAGMSGDLEAAERAERTSWPWPTLSVSGGFGRTSCGPWVSQHGAPENIAGRRISSWRACGCGCRWTINWGRS